MSAATRKSMKPAMKEVYPSRGVPVSQANTEARAMGGQAAKADKAVKDCPECINRAEGPYCAHCGSLMKARA